jgi:alpha-1,6-mannosyltransferase
VPIKTLHVTHAFHATSGGISTFYRAMLQSANELERPMRLIVPAEQDRIEEVGRYARIYHTQAPKAFSFDRRYRMLYPHHYLRNEGAIARILRAEQPDLVEVADKFALFYLGAALYKGLIQGLNRRPFVVGLYNERFDDNVRLWLTDSAPGRAFARWYVGHVYYGCFDHHIAVSEYAADELRAAVSARVRLRGAQVSVLPMGVDAERFRPGYRSVDFRARLLREAGWPDQTRILLYAGRISPEKNLDLLPDMMARLAQRVPQARLLLVGSGPMEDKLRKAFTQKSPGLAWLRGHATDRDWIARLFANADVFVHPNPREPFGIAPVEAMASGTPLVAPRAGGVLMYAHDANSWLAPPDPDAFAAAIADALTPSASRDRRAAQAVATARNLAWPIVTRNFFAQYDRVEAAFRAGNVEREQALEAVA